MEHYNLPCRETTIKISLVFLFFFSFLLSARHNAIQKCCDTGDSEIERRRKAN